MLKKLWCNKFKCNDQIRQPILFKEGLNTVLGDGEHSNSIGKSTFLLIIDFCFGGDDYPRKEKDTIDNIGHHTIYFAFEFEHKQYFFSRSTEYPNVVNVYNDENCKEYRTILLSNFREFLSKQYKCEIYDLTFRAIVGRFFRIYNRNTHNELRPLNATVREDDQSGIVNLLKLNNLYDQIDKIKENFEEANEKKRVFDNIKKYNIGSIASSFEEYNNNNEEIKKISNEIAVLKQENQTGQSDNDIINAERKSFLSKERKKLRNQKRLLTEKLDDIDFDEKYENKSFVRNLDKLKYFFPNESFLEIEEIDKFHNDVKKIISKEIIESNQETLDAIAFIDEQIKMIDDELTNYKTTPDVSEAVLERFSELNKKLQYLRESNQNFDKHKAINNDFKIQQNILERIVSNKTNQLENKFNSLMKSINILIDGNDIKAPVLKINSLKSYSFYTPNDTGTGTRHKGVIVFDLAVLESTSLPALIHDSIMFNSVEYQRRENILHQYNRHTKQIFIAYDDPENTTTEIKHLLFDNKVIQLSRNKEALFGKQWR